MEEKRTLPYDPVKMGPETQAKVHMSNSRRWPKPYELEYLLMRSGIGDKRTAIASRKKFEKDKPGMIDRTIGMLYKQVSPELILLLSNAASYSTDGKVKVRTIPLTNSQRPDIFVRIETSDSRNVLKEDIDDIYSFTWGLFYKHAGHPFYFTLDSELGPIQRALAWNGHSITNLDSLRSPEGRLRPRHKHHKWEGGYRFYSVPVENSKPHP